MTWWFKYWSCVFEYSWRDLMGISNVQRCRHGLFCISMKLSHGYFEYSWSDVMGILNVQKLTSSEYSKADARCKYSWNDLMDILNIQKLTSWTFWIIMKWRHWYFETNWRYGIIQKLTPWVFWIFIVTLVFLIFIQNYVDFWIFIVMTSLQNIPMKALREYSKYPWF